MSANRLLPSLLTVSAAALALLLPAGLSASPAASPRALARLSAGSLRYQGSFRLPAARSDRQTFDYGGTALAYDPLRRSLFVVGHDWYQLTAEVSIPRLGRGAIARLPRARYVQGFADATAGKLAHTGPRGSVYTGGGGNKIGGQLVYRGRLYGSVYVYYDASASQVGSHFVRTSTTLARGPSRGLFPIGRQGAGFVSGFMALVPAGWQSSLGGPALTGNCCIPIISRTSFGPSAFAFDPGRLGRRVTPVPDHPLVYYPQQHPTLGPWDGSWNPRRGRLFSGGTQIRGLVFPSGSRSVLFFGTQGIGRFCYGEGTPDRSQAFKPTPDGTIWCYDPDDSSKGTHAYPYVPEVWAYDATALAEVRAGRRRPWQVRPYATWRLRLPYRSPQIGGAAYDPARGLIYISQQYVDGAAPVIDVFRVG